MRGTLTTARGHRVRFTGRRYDPVGTRRLSNRERDRSRMWRGGLVRARGHDRGGDRPRRARTRLWAVALVALAATLALLATGCGGSDETAEPATPSETPAPPSEETAPPSEEPAGEPKVGGVLQFARNFETQDLNPMGSGQRLHLRRACRSSIRSSRPTRTRLPEVGPGLAESWESVGRRPHMDVPSAGRACSPTAIRSRRKT